MSSTPLEIIAPGLITQRWSEAEALGSTAWLWMNSKLHRDTPLHALGPLLIAAIKHRQFILAIENSRPVFYLSWANFDAAAETRYLAQHPIFMPDADWQSGERMWILDWIAPFGHTPIMHRLIQRELLADRPMRTLYHRGEERGLRIKQLHGRGIPASVARQWFESHPVQPPAKPRTSQATIQSRSHHE